MKKEIKENWEKDRFMIIGDDGICHSGRLIDPHIYKIRDLITQEKQKWVGEGLFNVIKTMSGKTYKEWLRENHPEELRNNQNLKKPAKTKRVCHRNTQLKSTLS